MEKEKKPKVDDEQKEKNMVQDFTARFRRAENALDSKRMMWNKIDKFDRSEQWLDAALPPWIPKPVTNYIRYVRTLKRANLASTIPSAHYTAKEEKYQEDMDKLQKAYNHVWQTEKVPRVVRRCIDRVILQGTALAIVYNDDTYVGGTYEKKDSPNNSLFRGRVCVKRFPILNFFPDPDAYRIDDCKYIETTENLSLKAVKNNKKFKEYAGQKLADLNHDMLESTDTATGQILDRENGPGKNGANIIGDEMVTVHAHWERYINEQGSCQLDVTYYIPNCQFILYRVEDVPVSEYPIAVLYDEEEENDFFGTSTAMDIFENQKIINRTSQTASTIGVLHQNPQKVISRTSGINAQELAKSGTMPGKVWVTNDDPSKSIFTTKPDDIPKGLFEIEDRMANNIKEMVGINEAYTGQSVGSLTTSSGVNSLIERATIRDKDKMVQIDEFVERISDLIILNIMHNWKEERPITTMDRNSVAVFDQYKPLNSETIKNLEWIVKSDIYAVAPTTQALRKQQADNLMQMQGQFNFEPAIITPEEWLRFQDFDMKDEIITRMKADREKMEKNKALNSAQMMVNLADTIRQNIAKGMPPEQAKQIATQAAEKMLADQQKAEMNGTRPKDAASQAQAPKGATGQMAMQAMAKGS